MLQIVEIVPDTSGAREYACSCLALSIRYLKLE